MNSFDEYDVNDDLPLNSPNKLIKFKKEEWKGKGKGKGIEDDLNKTEGKTARKPRPKLDFNRLLRGSRGLGYLAVTAKKQLKLSGQPGSESRDLSQISVYLQEWAKLVFPKMSIIDFLIKVEDICQSRIMKVIISRVSSVPCIYFLF